MEIKYNEQKINEIKEALARKLKEITFIETERIMIKAKDGKCIFLDKYRTQEFGFKSGDFIQINFDFKLYPRIEIGICAGVGEGSINSQETLFFLFESNHGVSCLTCSTLEDFKKMETEGKLIRI